MPLEINRNPTRRELRVFGALLFPGFFALVGGLLLYKTGSLGLAAAIWVPALLVSAVGLLHARFLRALYRGWLRAVYPLGWLISNLIFASIYYLLFTPVGLAMRLAGRDPLRLRRPAKTGTYWVANDPEPEADRYFKQY